MNPSRTSSNQRWDPSADGNSTCQAEGHIDTISVPSFPATISQEADSSFIVPAELLAGIECEFKL